MLPWISLNVSFATYDMDGNMILQLMEQPQALWNL